MMEETANGNIRAHGTNISMDEFTERITEIANQLKDEGLVITDMKLSLTFAGGKDAAEKSIVIDREDFDSITNHKYVKDDNIARILEFLQPHVYHWMTEIEINEFIGSFISLYNEIESDTKFIPPADPMKFCLEEDPMDINQYFEFHDLPYKFRNVCGKYQLKQRNTVNI